MALISELATALGLSLEGDAQLRVNGVTSLALAGPTDLSFVTEAQYIARALVSEAPAIITREGIDLPGKTVLRSENPMLSVAQVVPLLVPPSAPACGVHPSAVVDPQAEIAPTATVGPLTALGADVTVGENSVIGANVVIEANVRIGANCELHPNVTLHAGCRIGNRVIIQSGSVIGAAGYGYVQDAGRHVRIPHLGNVIIEDDVEIGANNAIDRATFGSTVIGSGTKTDNLVHIAHNVEIGEHSLILGQVGFAGSTKVGKYFIIAGQSAVNGHLTVPDNVTVGPKSALTRAGQSGETYYGFPARPIKQWQKTTTILNQLSKLPAGVVGQLAKLPPRKPNTDS